jgi:hypothetical protein
VTLIVAIRILARVHTNGVDDASFEVTPVPTSRQIDALGSADYVEAWRTVRENAGLMPERR